MAGRSMLESYDLGPLMGNGYMRRVELPVGRIYTGLDVFPRMNGLRFSLSAVLRPSLEHPEWLPFVVFDMPSEVWNIHAVQAAGDYMRSGFVRPPFDRVPSATSKALGLALDMRNAHELRFVVENRRRRYIKAGRLHLFVWSEYV